MSDIADALRAFKETPDVRAPKNPFRLISSFSRPASPSEISRAWTGMDVAAEARAFWAICGEARLCEDADYGQWGLVVLSPESSAQRTAKERHDRSSEIHESDVIIGAFLGDQELLILTCEGVLVARPLDQRSTWPRVAASLTEFLETYFREGGDKYWERRP